MISLSDLAIAYNPLRPGIEPATGPECLHRTKP